MTASEIAREASAALLGTCESLEIWLDDHYPEADPDEIYSLLEIERCPRCEWWVELGELVFGDGELDACDSCL